MAEHPIKQLASQAAEAASELAELMHPHRDFHHPGARWPRDLTKDENAALIPQLREALSDLATCVEGIAAQPGFDGMPADHLNEAGRLVTQAFLKIKEAEHSLSVGAQPQAVPRLAASDFPLAFLPLPGTAGPDPRRASTSPRPRNPRTP